MIAHISGLALASVCTLSLAQAGEPSVLHSACANAIEVGGKRVVGFASVMRGRFDVIGLGLVCDSKNEPLRLELSRVWFEKKQNAITEHSSAGEVTSFAYTVDANGVTIEFSGTLPELGKIEGRGMAVGQKGEIACTASFREAHASIPDEKDKWEIDCGLDAAKGGAQDPYVEEPKQADSGQERQARFPVGMVQLQLANGPLFIDSTLKIDGVKLPEPMALYLSPQISRHETRELGERTLKLLGIEAKPGVEIATDPTRVPAPWSDMPAVAEALSKL